MIKVLRNFIGYDINLFVPENKKEYLRGEIHRLHVKNKKRINRLIKIKYAIISIMHDFEYDIKKYKIMLNVNKLKELLDIDIQ